MNAQHFADEIAQYSWYHTLELAPGVETVGMFDHRPAIHHYLLPESCAGMRCLDVGTMDGFWAFEMERRGAAEVVAADVDVSDDLDWPVLYRPKVPTTRLDDTKAARFGLAKAALGSNVQRVIRSVYDVDVDLGEFDLIFCGDLLIHLKDPITALERIHRVCRGSAIICNPITRFRFGRKRPLAEFDGIDQFQWWALSVEAIERMMRAAGFASVDVGRAFELPARGDGRWRGLRAALRGWV
jgi:tRNA (mo5U34)-methyltransferase